MEGGGGRDISVPTSLVPTSLVPTSLVRDFHFRYTVQKGVFLQSEEGTDDAVFDFKKQHFGIIPTATGTEWHALTTHLHALNSSAPKSTHFKLLFLARHGQGWHNVAESKYGTRAWDCYYSLLRGADGLVWEDAQLTPLGEQQALDVHRLWTEEVGRGIPVPERFYVSPLTRALQTADLTFGNETGSGSRDRLDSGLSSPSPSTSTSPHPSAPLSRSNNSTYTPHVKELLREALGVHTCDRRSPRSQIATSFPHATFESGFAEQDTLWEADYREPASARRYRLAEFLDDVVASDEGAVLSFTSHSGAIASLLEVVGHRRFRLETGGVIPVLIKAERVEGRREVPPKEPSEAPPMCDGPPDVEGGLVSVG
ncbi:putative phosphoglycerate mutase pmu1 [Ascochyta lentis]